MSFPFTITNNSLTVVHNGKPVTVSKSAANFIPLRNALLAGDWKAVGENLTIPNSLAKWARGLFTLEGTELRYNGEPLPPALSARINQMAVEGESPDPLLRFYERLNLNPSNRSVTQLWDFLTHVGIPLTVDGFLLTYKSVRTDYLDHYTGTISNKPGEKPSMPRNQISDDPQHTCHQGLHVGALSYAQGFCGGSKIVICKVDPADVVCVPYDESQRKMRVCKYEVIGEWSGEVLSSTVFYGDEDEDYEDDSDQDTDGSTDIANEDGVRLMQRTIDELRRYAANQLHIVGASKVPGGKLALIDKILNVREDLAKAAKAKNKK